MKTQTNNLKAGQGTWAFTLIELLVVISIIGIIAAMVVAVIPAASRKRDEAAAKAQLAKIETALEDYRKKFGTYPPDNPIVASNAPYWNPLAYELGGLRRAGVNFIAECDPGHTVTPPMFGGVGSYFGLAGFVNADPARAKSFLSLKGGTSKTADYVLLTNGTPGLPAAMFLQVAAEHPSGSVNVWRYRAYPVNGRNPKSYDLWAEIKGKAGTNIIGNW